MSVLPVLAAVLGALGVSLIVFGGGATAVALLALARSWWRAGRSSVAPVSSSTPQARAPRRFEPRPELRKAGREASASTRETELLYLGRLGRDDQSLLPTVWMGREVLAFALEADGGSSAEEVRGPGGVTAR